MNREQMLNFLEPIWKAKGWDFKKLKAKPIYILQGIYLTYKKDNVKVNHIINEAKKENRYEQLKMSI